MKPFLKQKCTTTYNASSKKGFFVYLQTKYISQQISKETKQHPSKFSSFFYVKKQKQNQTKGQNICSNVLSAPEVLTRENILPFFQPNVDHIFFASHTFSPQSYGSFIFHRPLHTVTSRSRPYPNCTPRRKGAAPSQTAPKKEA